MNETNVSIESECPICLTEIQTSATLDCSHVFCKDCLLQHLAQKITCPLCRSPSKTYRCEYMIYDIMIPIPISIQQMLIEEIMLPPADVSSTNFFPVDFHAIQHAELQRTNYFNRAAKMYIYVSTGLSLCVMMFQIVVLINIFMVSYNICYYYEII